MSRARRLAELLSSPRVPWLAAGLAALLTSPALGVGLIADDYVLRAATTAPPVGPSELGPITAFRFMLPNEVPFAMDLGQMPWWTSPGLRIAFFRPLASVTHWIDFTLLARWPMAMHAVSLLWLAAAVAAAGLLYRRLLGASWVAGLAAILFALDPGHALAAGWLSSRNAVLATFFGLSALVAHDRARRDGDRRAALFAPLLTAASLASGEAGVGTLALLGAHALTLEGPGLGLGRRARALAPHVLVALAWAAIYKLQGYGTAHTDMYRNPVTSTGDFLSLAAWTLPINIGSRLGAMPPQLLSILTARAIPLFAATGVAFTALAARALAKTLRREPTARFFALGMVLAALPIAGTSPQDRNLFFVGFAGFAVIALIVQRAAEAPSLPLRAYAGWLLFLALGVALPCAPYNAKSALGLTRVSREPLSQVLLDDAVREQTVIFVNPPTQFFVSQIFAMRAGTSVPAPARMRALVPGIYPTRLARVDDRRLAAHAAGGILATSGTWPATDGPAPLMKVEYLAQMLTTFYRGPHEAMRAGEVVHLAGCDVTIDTSTDEAGPSDMTFTFDRSLDDPSLRWLVWQDDGYVPFVPPRVGEAVDVAPVSMAAVLQ